MLSEPNGVGETELEFETEAVIGEIGLEEEEFAVMVELALLVSVVGKAPYGAGGE